MLHTAVLIMIWFVSIPSHHGWIYFRSKIVLVSRRGKNNNKYSTGSIVSYLVDGWKERWRLLFVLLSSLFLIWLIGEHTKWEKKGSLWYNHFSRCPYLGSLCFFLFLSLLTSFFCPCGSLKNTTSLVHWYLTFLFNTIVKWEWYTSR